MKKSIFWCAKSITLGAIAAFAVATSSCNDDEIENSVSNPGSAVSTNANPFDCGCRLISASTSELSNERIHVNTKDIDLTNSNSNFSYRFTEENGGIYIVPSYNGLAQEVEGDVLTLKSKDGSEEKSIYLTVTPDFADMSLTDACAVGEESGATSTGDPVKDAVIRKMLRGFIPGKSAPVAQVTEPIFRTDFLLQMDQQAEQDGSHFLTFDTEKYSDYFYEKATTHNEVAKSNAKEAGFSLAIPIQGINLNLGIEASKTTTSKKSEDVETAMYGYKIRKASGCMNMNYLGIYYRHQLDEDPKKADFVKTTVAAIMNNHKETDEVNLTNDVIKALSLQPIMDKTFSKVLNDPDDICYKFYKNDEDGMRQLIRTYGMYIGIGCQVGGMAKTTLTKKSSATEMSVDEAVRLTLEAASQTKTSEKSSSKDEKQTDTKSDDDKTKGSSTITLEKMKEKVPVTTDAKASFGSKTSYNEIKTAMNIQFETQAWGGNDPQDITDYKISDNCNEWATISFACQSSNDTFEPAKTDNSDFIPIWKLCLDPTRREILRSLIEPDSKGKIGYFEYTSQAKKTLVIADIKFKAYGMNEEIKPVYEYDSRPNKKAMHLYIPMRCNEIYGLGSSAGDILDFGKWQIIGEQEDDYADKISHRMTAMVAYEYVYEDDIKDFGDFTGITSIRIGDVPQGKQARSGCDTFVITDGTSKINRKGGHYLMLTYAEDRTPLQNRFKGVGFMYTGNNHNGDKRYQVFASSLGTDWNPNYTSTKNDYDAAWKAGSFYNCEVTDYGHIWNGEYSSWPATWTIDTNKKVYPCATTWTVTRDITDDLKEAVSNKN